MKTKHLLLLLLVALAPWAAQAQATYTICEDFENVNVPSPGALVDLPSGWQADYPNYNPDLANYYAGVCSYGSNEYFSFWPTDGQLLATLGSNILIIPAGAEIDAGTECYVILPEYYKVSHISFNAWKEHASYGTLELGYIPSGSNGSSFHRLQTVNLVGRDNANLSNVSFSYNVSLPAATGYRLVFKWTHNATLDWYGAYLDNICVTVPKTRIANTASSTAMTWSQFASNVNSGITYSGQTVYLDEDISTTTMVGTDGTKCFQGQFEGQQHTITVNYNANAIYCSPFRYAKNANFRQLKITGTITNSSYKFSAGFVGNCAGNTQFIDCVSDVTINSSVNGDGTHGGFIAYIPSSASITFQACVFTGKLLGNRTHSCGGFCGYSDGSIICSHCIFSPTQITMNTNACATFSRVASSSSYNLIDNDYYTQTFGTEQGKLMHSVTSEAPVTMAVYGQESPNSTYHPLTQIQYFPTYSAGLKYHGTLYAGSGDIVHVTLSGGDSYNTNGSVNITNYSGGHYYFTMANYDLQIYARFNAPSNLQYTNLTSTSVKLNWTENGSANRWQICINDDLNNLITTYSRPHTLNGLTPETPYTARVRAIRGNYYSDWTTSISFTTTAIPAPTNLQCTAAATSATFNWTENGSSNTWQICFNGDETNLIDVSGRPYTHTGLTPETTYTAKVRSKNGAYYSAWSDEASFTTTAIPPASLPYTTDFETDCDWNLVNGDLTNAWTWGTAAHNGSGTHGLYVSNDGGTTNAYNNTRNTMVYAYKTFEFEEGSYGFAYDWIANGESTWDFMRVALVPDSVSLEAGTSLPSGFNHNTLPNGWIALDGGSKLNKATEWQTMSNEVMIPVSGTYKMVFAWRNDSSYGTNPPAAIDNVSITSVTCPAPTGLHIVQGSLSAHEVTMAWDNEEFAQYQYALIQNDFIPETITFNNPSVGNGQSHYNNLDPETSYTFFLRKYCSGEDQSAIVSLTFTTDVACPAPTDLDATEVYGYSAKLDWTASSDSYTVSYRTKAYSTSLYEQFNNDAVPTGWMTYSGFVDNVIAGTATLTEVVGGWYTNSLVFGDFNMKVNIFGSNCRYWLVTPEVNVGSNDTLVFDLALTDNANSDPIEDPTAQADDRFIVLVYADGAWTILREWNNTGSDDVYNTIATTGEQVSINLSAYAGKTVKIAFYGESTTSGGDNDLHIDNVDIGLSVPAGEWQTVIVNQVPVWLTDLTPETPYEAKVQGDCGDDGLSEETALISFTTIEACPMPTALTVDANLITSNTANLQWNGSIDVQSYTVRYRTAAGINQPVFSEGFENGLGDWTLRDCHASTGINASAAHSGQCGFRFYYNTTPPQYLISPELSGITEGMRLEFYYRNHSTNYPETFQMGFSCTDNATESFTFGEEITASDAEWHLYSESIPAGTKYICWKLTSNDQYYLYIDDIVVGTVVPSSEWLTTTSSSANVTLTGLTPETAYEAQVKSDCSEPRWSEMLTFNTMPLSSTPTNLQCTALTATSAELSWSCETALDSYTVRYRTAPVFSEGFENGLDDWTLRDCYANTGINASAAHSGQCGFRFYFNSTPPQYLISPELSDITEGMRLEFYYRNHSTNYPETFQMGFSCTDNATESFTFGEEITASDTQWHLYSEPIPAGTKYICWKLTSNDQYYLYIDDVIIAEWQTITAATTHATLTGLNSGTTYVAQVKGDCEDCQWSETVSFTTLETQTLSLSAGVNWVSFYVETTLDDLKAALLSALNNASGIKITSHSNGFTSWNGSSWRGSLNPFDVSQMYVIEVPATCAISLEAMPIDPAAHPITIVNGTNWIGFPLSADMTLTNAFNGFAVNGDKVSSLNDGNANYQGSWNGGLSTLQPGQGYKLEVTTTEQRTLVFPSGAKKATPFMPMGK